jgi:anti-sigma28 factor (negative regulator of flagellin synthesis)
MRIDDLNRASQSQEAAKTQAVRTDRSDRTSESATPSTTAGPDDASISEVATTLAARDARVEMLRMRVETGEYRVAAGEVAASIIDEHMAD